MVDTLKKMKMMILNRKKVTETETETAKVETGTAVGRSRRGTRVVIILCVTGLARVALLMAPLVGFNWAVNTQESPAPNSQDKPQNPSVDLLR